MKIPCTCIFRSLYATREDWEQKSSGDFFCEVTSFVCQRGEGLNDLSLSLRVPSKKRRKLVKLTKPTNSSRTELERMVLAHSITGKLSQEENCLQWLNCLCTWRIKVPKLRLEQTQVISPRLIGRKRKME